MNQDSIYTAITGTKHYFGIEFFKIGQMVRLVKEPDNTHDQEAIRAEISPIGQLGYVANSSFSVPKGCRSAGRIYDTFDGEIYGIVRFVVKDSVILELVEIFTEIHILGNLKGNMDDLTEYNMKNEDESLKEMSINYKGV